MITAGAISLEPALEWIASVMAGHDGPWWIIGSAALCLHGIEGLDPEDVDVLLPATAADGLAALVGADCIKLPPSDRFRSAAFSWRMAGDRKVEFMAGLEVATHQGWQPVLPTSRLEIQIDAARLYVPTLSELVAMLRQFDRAKDLQRLAKIRAQRPAIFMSA